MAKPSTFAPTASSLIAFSLWAAAAWGCECGGQMLPSPETQLRNSTRAFSGSVVAVDQKLVPAGDETVGVIKQTVSFRVDRNWKGVRPGQIVTIRSMVSGGTCSELVTKPSARTADFPAFEPPPMPLNREMTKFKKIDWDYSRWIIFDEPNICSLSRPLVAGQPIGASQLERKLNQIASQKRLDQRQKQ